MADPRPPLDVVCMALQNGDVFDRRVDHHLATIPAQIRRFGILASVPTSEFPTLLALGELDSYFMALERGADWITKVRARGLHVNTNIDDVHAKLRARLDDVVKYYDDISRGVTFVGEKDAWLSPDVIFVLGCSDPSELYTRVFAAELVRRRASDPAVVLSGVGWNRKLSEAQQMKQVWPGSLNAKSVVVEELSMDTIGNAVFGRLMLAEEGLIDLRSDPLKVCVVTSQYHAMRAYRTFTAVFGKQDQVAVQAAIGVPPANGLPRDVVIGQLRREHTSFRRTFSLEHYYMDRAERVEEGDIETVLYQMLLTHDLYKGRSDLLRRFNSVFEQFPPSSKTSPRVLGEAKDGQTPLAVDLKMEARSVSE
jgi:uncharacterized SAM-binding protein YcdF (DUF218 family)